MSADGSKTTVDDITGPGALRYGFLYAVTVLVSNTVVAGLFGVSPLTLVAMTVLNALLLFYALARYVDNLLAYHGLVD